LLLLDKGRPSIPMAILTSLKSDVAYLNIPAVKPK